MESPGLVRTKNPAICGVFMCYLDFTGHPWTSDWWAHQERQSRAAMRDQRTAARQSISRESVTAEATRLHPLANATQKRLKQMDGWTEYKGLRSAPKEVLDIEVTKDSIDRAALIASAVLNELQRVGTTIQIDGEKGRTILQLRNTKIGLKISEHVARTAHEATPAEKRALDRYRSSSGWGAGTVEYPHIPQYDFTPTGLLTITASGYPERNWRDTKRTPLENRIGEVIAGIISLAEEVRDRETEIARGRAEHARKVEHYEEEIARRTQERRAYRALRIDAKNWAAATQLRQYLRAVESAAIQMGGTAEEQAAWLEWAARKADWLDPTILVSDAILDAPEPEKPGYSYW